jgi:pSer/pThr/pTyr-binding forkhead associated (FHA) protein
MQLQNAQKYITETVAEDMATQFLVYQNSKYLQENKFTQPEVTIGSNPDADLVLNHSAVADFHANLFFKAGQILLKNNKPYNGLRVNGRSVIKTVLQLWDVIDIGPFSIVIQQNQEIIEKTPNIDIAPVTPATAIQQTPVFKSSPPSNEDNTDSSRYAVILENDYANDEARDRVAKQLGSLFKTDSARIRPLLDRSQHILKKNLPLEHAMRLQKTLQKAGAVYSIKPHDEIQDHSPVKGTIAPIISPVNIPKPDPIALPEVQTSDEDAASASSLNTVAQSMWEDEDEADLPASFTLKEKLAISSAQTHVRRRTKTAMKPQLEIVRSIGERVVDVQYIAKRGRYYIQVELTYHPGEAWPD